MGEGLLLNRVGPRVLGCGVPGSPGVFGDLGVALVHQGGEFGDLLGILFGEVGGFGDVLVEIEEVGGLLCVLLPLPLIAEDEEFPWFGADAGEIAAGGVVEELVARGLCFLGEECGDVHAVDFLVVTEWLVGELGDGGEEVDGGGEFGAGGVGRNAAGGPHDAGDALSAFEVGSFAVAEWFGGAAVVFKMQPGAVVGGEDDVGVVGETFLADGVHEAADLGVDVFDDAGVSILRIRVADILRYEERDVRHAVGEVEEEGLLLVGGDELDGFVGVAAGDGALVDGEFDDFLISDERGAPVEDVFILILPRGVPTDPWLPLVVGVVHVVGVGNAVVAVETLGAGEAFRVVAEVPLADAGGCVALGFEVIGDGDLVGVHAAGAGGKEDVLLHADAFRVATGEQAGTGRSADRARDHEVGELPAFLGQLVEMRGLDGLRSETAQVVVALIIGEDDDEVRLGRGAEREEGGEEEEEAHGPD